MSATGDICGVAAYKLLVPRKRRAGYAAAFGTGQVAEAIIAQNGISETLHCLHDAPWMCQYFSQDRKGDKDNAEV